jgi:hypothetical protein
MTEVHEITPLLYLKIDRKDVELMIIKEPRALTCHLGPLDVEQLFLYLSKVLIEYYLSKVEDLKRKVAQTKDEEKRLELVREGDRTENLIELLRKVQDAILS